MVWIGILWPMSFHLSALPSCSRNTLFFPLRPPETQVCLLRWPIGGKDLVRRCVWVEHWSGHFLSKGKTHPIPDPGRLREQPWQASRSRTHGPGAQSGHTSPLQSLTPSSPLLAQKDRLRIRGHFCQKAPVKQGRACWEKSVKSLRGWIWMSRDPCKCFWTRGLDKAGSVPALPCQTKQVFPAALLPAITSCQIFQKAVAACIVSNQLKPPPPIYFSAFLLCLKYLCMTVLLLMQTGETRVNCSLWSFWLKKYLWQKICQVFQWQML